MGNGQRDGLRYSGVIGCVGRGESDREGISTRRRNNAGSRGIDESSRHGCGRIQLRDRKRCSIRDACRVAPGDDRGSLSDDQLDGLGRAGVVGGVSWGEGHRKRVVSDWKNSARGRSVSQRTRIRGGSVELDDGEGCSIVDRSGRVPANARRGLIDGELNSFGDARVVGRVGRCESDGESDGASGRHRTSCRGIDQRTGDRRTCIELSTGECGAISDRSGRCPGNHRRQLCNG